jgi:tetratricopeptide (TPR) repeat protein
MTDANKTVFISYRRDVSAFIARAVFMDLRAHGYDAFMDVESIDSGAFDTVILNQIAARAHFLVILTQGTLERCVEPGDWLRREIETAMNLERNIVPLMVSGFSFKEAEPYLTGKLSKLVRYNALNVPHDYFEAAMERLRSRFLKQPVDSPLTPTPVEDTKKVEEMIDEAANEPTPTKEELSAESLFARAYSKQQNGDLEGAIADYTQAIRIKPDYVDAYNNRGNARSNQGDMAGAIVDYGEAIRIKPEYAKAYYNRGNARSDQGDKAGAIADYTEAIRIDPDHAYAYNNRGLARYAQGDIAGAIADYGEAIRIQPEYANAHENRGFIHYNRGNLAEAVADYDQAIELEPKSVNSYNNRGEVYFALGDYAKALADFDKAYELVSDEPVVVGRLAITHYARGNHELAKDLWKSLLKLDERYRDVDWVKAEFNWHEALVEEARKLIARLD